MADDEESVGYKRPPKHSRFKKGQSPNPAGRPRKRTSDSVLSTFVTIRIDGKPVSMRREEAALLLLMSKGLQERDSVALSSFLKHSREIRPSQEKKPRAVRVIREKAVCKALPDKLLEAVGAIKRVALAGSGDLICYALEIWMLEEALKRLNGKLFSEEQISKIAADTTDPATARAILGQYLRDQRDGPHSLNIAGQSNEVHESICK